MRGQIPLFSVGGTAPTSAPTDAATMEKATDVPVAATTANPDTSASK